MKLWARLVLLSAVLVGAWQSASAGRQSSGLRSESSDSLSSVALLVRCYAHLTGTRISSTDPRFLAVVAGADPIQTCVDVLESAQFTADGLLPGVVMNGATPSDVSQVSLESQRVLKTLYSYFTTWFKNENVYQLAANVNENVNSFADSNNLKEPAAHVTRAFFQPGVGVQELVTGSYMMEEIRSQGRAQSGPTSGSQQPVDPNAVPGSGDSDSLWQMAALAIGDGAFRFWNPGFPQVGALVGIQPVSPITAQAEKFNNTFRALHFDGVDNYRQDLKHFQ
jgi:hypothetical protein